jgi:hypothetical protein
MHGCPVALGVPVSAPADWEDGAPRLYVLVRVWKRLRKVACGCRSTMIGCEAEVGSAAALALTTMHVTPTRSNFKTRRKATAGPVCTVQGTGW